MTLLDDDIDDLLRAFRADEGVLDEATRSRVWTRVCEDAPDAPRALDALDALAPPADALDALDALAPPADADRLHRARPRARVLAAAAAVLVLLAVAGLALRPDSDDRPITAGPSSEPLPRDLQALADDVAGRPVTVLGSSPAARYTHVVLTRRVQGTAVSEPTVRTEERWVDIDGAGRLRIGGGAARDETSDAPGSYVLGPLPPAVVVGLPDDPDAVADALLAHGAEDAGIGNVATLVDLLAHTGIPGPARAAVLRFLDRLGFHPVTAPGLGPNLTRVEGPGPDGSMLQADVDLRTGEVVASVLTTGQGGRDARTYTVADLRADRDG